ncbi:MAG: DUF2341 domain-containing protein, partial [Anaerolineales bacterium]|nr:DUF2341 domain-containing protein [Anaerolineales bacterium]
ANGNNLTSGGDTVTLATTLGSLGSVTDNGDGTYTATLTSATSTGTATITGTVNAAAITDDATVDFVPGPADETTSLITAAPTSIVADGISTSTITVQLKDANGNNLTSGGDTVTLATTLGSLGSVTDNGDSTYTATLTSATSTGTATITGTVNSAAITDDATVDFVSAIPDPGTSLITAAPTSIPNDDATTSTITVQLRDSQLNNLTVGGDTVVLFTDLGTLSSVTDNSDGTYTATLTSATTGTATITGKVNGYWLVDTATVDVTTVAWAQCDYEFRKVITIQASQVTADQTNFPVLINLASDTELAASARNDGFDISFTSDDGLTKLSHQIEDFNGGTGALVAWVKVPNLSSSVDTDIYIYYGNPTATNQEDADGVWDANYMGVWHLNESGTGALFEYRDSTANANHGTGGKDYGAFVPAQAGGQIGFGQTFDGVNDFIDTGNSGWYDTNWTHRRRIIVDSSKVSGSADFTDFVVLIDATVPDWRHTSNGGNVGKLDGTDIFFTNDEGGKYEHQIEHYDPVTGHVVAWVELFGLFYRDDTTIYMYYGNPAAADQQQVAATWSNGYESVYHLHDDFADSSGNQVAGTNNGSVDIAGMAGDGQTFDGSSYIDTNWSSNYVASQDFTWSGWFKVTTVNSSDDIMGIEDRGLGDDSEIRLSVRDNVVPNGQA